MAGNNPQPTKARAKSGRVLGIKRPIALGLAVAALSAGGVALAVVLMNSEQTTPPQDRVQASSSTSMPTATPAPQAPAVSSGGESQSPVVAPEATESPAAAPGDVQPEITPAPDGATTQQTSTGPGGASTATPVPESPAPSGTAGPDTPASTDGTPPSESETLPSDEGQGPVEDGQGPAGEQDATPKPGPRGESIYLEPDYVPPRPENSLLAPTPTPTTAGEATPAPQTASPTPIPGGSSGPVTVVVEEIFEVVASSDDAYAANLKEWPGYSQDGGSIYVGSPLPGTAGQNDNSFVVAGWRWAGVNIPAGAVIEEAWVELAQASWGYDFVTLLRFQNSPDPGTFSINSSPVHRMVNTTAFALPWNWGGPDHVTGPGTRFQTPSLVQGIQELVNRYGGLQSIVMLEDGRGVPNGTYHGWLAFDNNSQANMGAKLHVKYSYLLN